MWKKSVLAELIDQAVDSCYECGEGRCEDDENETGLLVTAEWTDCSEPEYQSIIRITIFQDGVLKLSYEDPETKCN